MGEGYSHWHTDVPISRDDDQDGYTVADAERDDERDALGNADDLLTRETDMADTTPRCPDCGARNPHGTPCQVPKKK